MRHPIRLLDAAANRAVEAARVLEDLARFCVDDASVTAQYKALRHELVAALGAIDAGTREANRDLGGDVGTTIEGANEGRRESLASLGAANGSRLCEALRTLEEGMKLVGGADSKWRMIESIRYRAYTLNAQLALRLRTTAVRQWRVCVLFTQSLCRRPCRDVLNEVLAAGADCIQLREKEMSTAELVAHARVVVSRAHEVGTSVIINDRVDIALAAGADGVHLGGSDLAIADARRIAGGALLIGATAHNADEARAAIEHGADGCGIGAMFSSTVKPEQPPSGPMWMAEFAAKWPKMPHLAIGGITPENAVQLRAVGCRGVAVSTSVCAADDPGAQVARLCEIFS
ncbi:MAG: thiamine phosphate synthase [Phycisphaerales bacterium]|nr:thiamine phosphate synthase [Phycisphaerales bacterium]